jgi:O-antigen ligase
LNRTTLANRIGQLGLIYFSFSVFYGKAQSNQGLLLILAALLLGKTLDYKKIIRDPLFISSVVFLAYILLRAAAAVLEHPDAAGMVVGYASRWAYLGLLPAVLVAAAIGACRFKPHHLLGLATAGFILRIALRTEWADWYNFYAKYLTEEYARASFGFAMINLPLWCLFLLIGLILYYDDFIRKGPWPLKVLKFSGLLTAAGLLVFIIVISKARSLWILSCLFIPTCVFLKAFERRKINLKIAGLVTLLVLIVPGGFIYKNLDFFQKRLTTEKEVISRIVDMQHTDIPPTSIGLRYYMMRVFADNASARPVFGWGPGLSKPLLTESSYAGMQEVSHFHNIFIETYLQLGLVGLGLFLTMFGILFRAALFTEHELYNATRFSWLLLCSAAIFCLTGLIEHTLWSSATPYFFALVGGLAYAPTAQRYTLTPHMPAPKNLHGTS